MAGKYAGDEPLPRVPRRGVLIGLEVVLQEGTCAEPAEIDGLPPLLDVVRASPSV